MRKRSRVRKHTFARAQAGDWCTEHWYKWKTFVWAEVEWKPLTNKFIDKKGNPRLVYSSDDVLKERAVWCASFQLPSTQIHTKGMVSMTMAAAWRS